MTNEIVVARDDLRPTSDLSVREAAQDIHGEDVEFLDERSPFESDEGQPTLDEFGIVR